MSRTCFVVPEVVTLPLFDDGILWIRVKKQLNAGEVRVLAGSAFTRVSRTGTLDEPSVAFDLNVEAGAFQKIVMYLMDWNLQDASGKTVAIDSLKMKTEALRALDPDVFSEIENVIDRHAEAIEQEKKRQSGSLTPSTTS